MWLLRLHIAFSILCLLTFLGFRLVFKEKIKENGYGKDGKKKHIVSVIWLFFVPILNLFLVIALFFMITKTKSDMEELVKQLKESEEN